MQNYENKKPSYFATPSPQLIHALHTALTQILARPLAERFSKHAEVSDRIKRFVTQLGLKQVASSAENQAHGMTAIYLPERVTQAELLPRLAKKEVVFAGGIHKEIASRYIRFGHMGVSVVSPCMLLPCPTVFCIWPSLLLTDTTGGNSWILQEATSIAPSRHWRRGWPSAGIVWHRCWMTRQLYTILHQIIVTGFQFCYRSGAVYRPPIGEGRKKIRRDDLAGKMQSGMLWQNLSILIWILRRRTMGM